ncbi:hypothetical protein BU15DRAFT_91038 [Melanogaster broomeanus]|nr:hypothetical protein BU15DRAFT_91038 [Melanogaster broomeanus]
MDVSEGPFFWGFLLLHVSANLLPPSVEQSTCSWPVRFWLRPANFFVALYLYTRAEPFLSSSSAAVRFRRADAGPLTDLHLFPAGLFLVHCANRDLISLLRTPSRSKARIIVLLTSIFFNPITGTLMASYVRSTFCEDVLRDEIHLDIRHDAQAKGKAKSDDNQRKEYYDIPHGYLYIVVWLRVAAAPIPPLTSHAVIICAIQPPWLLFLSEISVMVTKAYRGYRWYQEDFPNYPKERGP